MMRGDSLAPGLLIAMPSLDEPPFKRAVILMLEHDQQGALGRRLRQSTLLTPTRIRGRACWRATPIKRWVSMPLRNLLTAR